MSAFHLCCILMSEILKTALNHSVQLLSVYTGWILHINLKMAALVCQDCITTHKVLFSL